MLAAEKQLEYPPEHAQMWVMWYTSCTWWERAFDAIILPLCNRGMLSSVDVDGADKQQHASSLQARG